MYMRIVCKVKRVICEKLQPIVCVGVISAMVCFQLFSALVNPSIANDTIVEITPQGLQFKTEKNISIEREDLYISLKKVEVSYIFKNHSDKDITAEMAFPVPPYKIFDFKIVNHSHKPINFRDFIVEVNNRQITYKKEIRALVNGKDHTTLLRSLNISIEDFGKYDFANPNQASDISKLTEENRKILANLGILNVTEPCWTVEMKYHWTQTFPANSNVSIKHSYTPYYGGEPGTFHWNMWTNKLEGDINERIVKESCLDQKTEKAIEKKMIGKLEVYIYYTWVSYILTTANNWKTPIKDFHLTLEKSENAIISLCFDHKLVKTSPNRFEADIENFVPKRDLEVYFIHVK